MLRSDYWEAEKNLKTTPGSDCALKFARRLLGFIGGKITEGLLLERLPGVAGGKYLRSGSL